MLEVLIYGLFALIIAPVFLFVILICVFALLILSPILLPLFALSFLQGDNT